MLSLSKRGCLLGDGVSSKGKETEAGEPIRTLTFELSGLMLDAQELNSLLSEPHAWDVLFNASADGTKPYLRGLKALELADSAEHAYVTLTYGLDAKQMIFADCKLSKIKLELCDGGDTALTCKVTATPALDESLAELFEQFGKRIDAEVRADLASAQQDLPLSKHGEGERPEVSPGKVKRVRPRGNKHARRTPSRKRNGARASAH